MRVFSVLIGRWIFLFVYFGRYIVSFVSNLWSILELKNSLNIKILNKGEKKRNVIFVKI